MKTNNIIVYFKELFKHIADKCVAVADKHDDLKSREREEIKKIRYGYNMKELVNSSCSISASGERYTDVDIFNNPYSHRSITRYLKGTVADITANVYSDRLLQWDFVRTKDLMHKYFGDKGDYYDDRKPEQIEAFLRERLELPNLNLVTIMESVNVSNGYPVWFFGYNEGEQ